MGSDCISIAYLFIFQHLKEGIQDFHRKYVLVPAD